MLHRDPPPEPPGVHELRTMCRNARAVVEACELLRLEQGGVFEGAHYPHAQLRDYFAGQTLKDHHHHPPLDGAFILPE